MKYALLVYLKPGRLDGMDQSEREAISGEYFAISDLPGCTEGAQLASLDSATTVRVEDGRMLTTDGPFADTKEVFGGYFVFEVPNLDEALDVAAKIPAARLGGSVEVRPVVGG